MKESFQKVGLSKGKKGEGNKKREERAFCFSFCFKKGSLQGAKGRSSSSLFGTSRTRDISVSDVGKVWGQRIQEK